MQMRILKHLGYKGVSVGELIPYLKGDKRGKVAGITFDDGYRNNLTEALPILQQMGFSATCYIISQKIGSVNEWDLDKGIPENLLMNEEEVREWIFNGMEIGSHTCSHVRLTECSEEEAKSEIEQSKIDLEETFGLPIGQFCYPWGKTNKNITDHVAIAGYQSATTTDRGRANSSDSLLSLPRIPVTHSTLPHLFLIKLLSHYEDNHA